MPAWVIAASMAGFGSLVRESGLGLDIALVATAGIWGLPGQIAFVELYMVGAPALVIVLAVSVANARFLPMIVSMLPVLRHRPGVRAWHFAAAQTISVNIWAGSIGRYPGLPAEQRAPYFWGYSTTCVAAGLAGTWAGFVLAGALPREVTIGLVFLNAIYFCLVFADIRHRASILALLIGAPSGLLVHLLYPDWGLLASGVVAGSAAFAVDRLLRGPA